MLEEVYGQRKATYRRQRSALVMNGIRKGTMESNNKMVVRVNFIV